jgi:hypothetical protein
MHKSPAHGYILVQKCFKLKITVLKKYTLHCDNRGLEVKVNQRACRHMVLFPSVVATVIVLGHLGAHGCMWWPTDVELKNSSYMVV